MVIKLPKSVELILSKLNNCGYEAYVVGGCVRDSIIGITPHDWDICTSALPEQVMEIFEGYKIIPTGLKHGTVTIIIDDVQYEVTTYRIDGKYEDNRHPKEVSFTSDLKEDLSRRDFTINAMAYNPSIGLVDYFGGKKDIRKKLIKCVGNPDERFNEDALRIMRAVRFASILNYHIEDNTLESIKKNKMLLKNVSMERINSEFIKTIEVSYKREMAELIQVVVPELTEKMIYDSLVMVGTFCSSVYTRLALIFNFDKDKLKEILQRLKFDNKTIKNVVDTHELIYRFRDKNSISSPKYCIKIILNQNADIVRSVIEGIRCTSYLDSDTDYYFLANIMSKHLKECEEGCYKISQLAVNGNDMKSIGLEGKAIGEMLESLLLAVFAEEVSNTYDDLMEYTRKIRNGKE